MEILFEEVVEGRPWVLMVLLSFLIAAAVTALVGISLNIDSVDVILAFLSVCTIFMFLVLFFTGAHDSTTQYTVRVMDDTGYRALVEEYEIIEKKSDDVYVVEKKEEQA